MPVDLRERVAIVTGAANGLGRAHAVALARAGARIVVNDVSGADETVAAIRGAGGEAIPSNLAVGDAAAGAAIVDAALTTWGRLDAVVNNAGILRDRTIPKLSPHELESVLRVHLLGSFYVAQAAYRHMKEQRYGRLVHTTSGGGAFGAGGQLNYAAAKSGILGMSRTFAIEGVRYGIASNCVAPLARTQMSGDVFGPLTNRLTPDAVSPMVVYLASPQATVTGEVFSAGGGRFARIFTAFTPGWVAERSVDADDIAAHLEEIRDVANYTIPTSGADEVMQLVTQWAGA